VEIFSSPYGLHPEINRQIMKKSLEESNKRNVINKERENIAYGFLLVMDSEYRVAKLQSYNCNVTIQL
jgi:hypothetical protein